MVDATLFIDVWGTYFRQILSRDWVEQIAKNSVSAFSGGVVIIQNNIPKNLMSEYYALLANRLGDGWIHRVFAVDDEEYEHGEHALLQRDLSPQDFHERPYESLADLVAIEKCCTEYLVFICGDALPWGRSNWVSEGIGVLKIQPEVMIVNPVWNGFYDHARAESFAEDDQCYYSRGFSDQCYLARTADLKADIYHETNPEADRAFCAAHGNTFEKRVNAYMRNHGKIRASLKSAAYITRP